MRVDASVGEAEAAASDLFQEERANSLAIERALRVITDARVGEEVREVVPQAKLRVVAVGMLEALDRRDGFDALRQRLEPIDALLQRGQVGIGASGGHARDVPGCCDGQRRERTAHDEPGHARLLDAREVQRASANQRAAGAAGGAIVAGSQCSSALPLTNRQVSNHVV